MCLVPIMITFITKHNSSIFTLVKYGSSNIHLLFKTIPLLNLIIILTPHMKCMKSKEKEETKTVHVYFK